MAKPSQAKNPEKPEEASGALDRRTRPDVPGNLAVETPDTNAHEAQREKPALNTDPQAVADEEILADAPREPNEADSAPPSIPSAAAVFSEDSTRAATSTPVLPGHVIANRYEVLSVLGEGGMGIVYRCRDQANGEQLAVKRVIPPPGNLAHDYVMWFYKEARALAALDHPNIVKAQDFGQLRDGSPYLAMELVSGASLHELAHARIKFPLIWVTIDQILSALAHAHARGIVHGDLKPSNVLVERIEGQTPRVHVLDFGLAWLRQDAHDERLDGSKPMEFAPHAGAGTPGYMAPEQIQHEMHHVCGATDMYSLGCIMYRLLAGHAPFTGESKELLRVHAFDRVPKLKLALEAPEEAANFVTQLLAKKPWDRFEFAAAARREWQKLKPETLPKVWDFPSLVRASDIQAAAPTRRTGTRGPNPDLAPAPEHAPGLLSIRPSPLVGRDEERKKLEAICQEMVDGVGPPHRLVILVGPAGCGKSRLAEWLCETMHERGTMVPLRARYRKLRSSVDGMLGAAAHYYNFERTDRDTIERSLLERWRVKRDDKNGRAWVAGAAEWMKPVGGSSSDQPVGPSGIRFTLDTLETRRMVIRYTLRKISAGRPLLFWLDDLHNGGPATFEGFIRIHQEETDVKIVMVATARHEDVALGTPAAERLRQLRDVMDGTVIEVQPLPPETTKEMLRASLPLDDAAVEEAARRSRGNPLFALQQLHAWALGGNMEFLNGTYRVPPEVLATRPQTTAELWDSRVNSVPEQYRAAAVAAATLGGEIRRNVLRELVASLGIAPEPAIVALQNAEVLIPRSSGRYSWPHELLQEHLSAQLSERPDRERFYRAAAAALLTHPQANTRRIVRQRVVNLIHAGDHDPAALLLFDFLQRGWNGAREPLSTLSDLDLLKGKLTGRMLALKNRWQAEAMRHVGRLAEASTLAELARTRFEDAGDDENVAHCLRLQGHLMSEQGSSAEGLELVKKALLAFAEQSHVLGQALCEAVAGEIEFQLGDYESARLTIQSGERNFAALDQPVGRGQCLLLLSWIEHSEGTTDRSRRLAQEARNEFERAGYRLGTAQADVSIAHVEHRLLNFHSSEAGAFEALQTFDVLRTPRGQAACDRLLAMIGVDTDDLDMAELHTDRAHKQFIKMGDPWGVMESKLLFCQLALVRHQPERARALIEECSRIVVEEAEAKQHYLLTCAWYEHSRGRPDRAFEFIEAAADVFGPRTRAGDHTPHLLARLSRFEWPEHALNRIEAWRALLNDRARRKVS